MTRRAGSADLPLHTGRVPAWLGQRMARLGAVITQAVVHHYGRDEFLRRLAHPFWFQSFGAVMGMDWHSSGITTSVIGALKRGLAPLQDELGLYVCGGRGRHSRRTPDELLAVGEATGLDATPLVATSRMVAKVDSAAVQDGFDLYLHGFVVAADGRWTVVQQGMHTGRRMARRYHWLSDDVSSFVEAPHAAIEGRVTGRPVMNLTDRRADASRTGQVELLHAMGPDRLTRELMRIEGHAPPPPPAQGELPYLCMPAHHDVQPQDVNMRRLHGALAAAREAGPRDFPDLLRVPGVGARTVRALALVAEVVHGAPCRFDDPARFSLAHGGKDRHPYPVPVAVYDRTLSVMKAAVSAARLGREERLDAIRRLDAAARRLERDVGGPSFSAIMGEERARSHDYGGRSVFGYEPPPSGRVSEGQRNGIMRHDNQPHDQQGHEGEASRNAG
ncbi:hypothetical protein B0W47_07060 [Komagataeibacter nataicola]|uniref:DUF763 domain-containing protein n=1 Tax=Komagataeibacter nataicola TaxID=265960 RepID=A0A9N7H1V7_9PROT|nr:DUF763 domain-containing protein [Komagataeibacter nataicola]AQU87270.1 hypothetical protein B0W47_07060 [Komagataeibacter nataicola]PYD67464.1 hypothetical protein CDI09_02770 [Komagataeibacter nataicola]WEQ55840.1 DUF763 domain-containing protein [Komagataeibacter nataicola]WNM09297.1 DUF763 domain-containing protein [Komagataeibacter nataicola]GBR14846.1 hypothetical protein AA0616_0411 [Komagataeibacter nataicola NRIC 0616]